MGHKADSSTHKAGFCTQTGPQGPHHHCEAEKAQRRSRTGKQARWEARARGAGSKGSKSHFAHSATARTRTTVDLRARPPGRRPRRCRHSPGTPLPKHRSGAHAGRPANRPGLMLRGTSHGQEHGRGNKMDMLTALRWRPTLVKEKLGDLGRARGRRQRDARPQ